MNLNLNVGPQPATDGTNPLGRGGRSGEMIAQLLHGKYFEQAFRGNLFSATNVAAQAVSVALATTYTGLVISNPLGNTKNAVLIGVNFALSVAPVAIASLHLLAGYSATSPVVHTTPLASPGIQNNLVGTGPASTMKADSAATIVNPGYLIPLSSGFTAGAFPSTMPAFIDAAGQFVFPPGSWFAFGALTAVTGFAGFTWEEVSI